MDIPDLVPDRDALTCRWNCGGMIGGLAWYRAMFTLILERPLSEQETNEIFSKVSGYRPVRWDDTWEYYTSLPQPAESYWRSSV